MLGHGLAASPLRRECRGSSSRTLLILVGTTGFVLLIVCASVANLAVARTMRRDRGSRSERRSARAGDAFGDS